MKDGNGQHDFDFIAQLLRHQNAILDVLLHHLAHVEATLFALTLKALPEENLCIAKNMKDHAADDLQRHDGRGGTKPRRILNPRVMDGRSAPH